MSLTGKGAKARFYFTVRTSLLSLPWWKSGERVNVQFGAGEHDNMVRIAPGHDFPVIVLGKGNTSPSIIVPAPSRYAAHAPALRLPVRFTIERGALVVGLHVVGLHIEKQPFRGVGSTGPNPHPLMRRPGT